MLDESHKQFFEALENNCLDTVRANDRNWFIALHCNRRNEIEARGSQKDGFLAEIELTKLGANALTL